MGPKKENKKPKASFTMNLLVAAVVAEYDTSVLSFVLAYTSYRLQGRFHNLWSCGKAERYTFLRIRILIKMAKSLEVCWCVWGVSRRYLTWISYPASWTTFFGFPELNKHTDDSFLDSLHTLGIHGTNFWYGIKLSSPLNLASHVTNMLFAKWRKWRKWRQNTELLYKNLCKLQIRRCVH